MSTSKHRPIVRWIALILILVMTLGIAEVGIRLFIPHPRYPYYMVADPYVGVKFQPGYKGRSTNIFGEFDVAVSMNQEGFRDRDWSIDKAPGTFRIAFVGDSFTAAEQVEEADCFVRRTETLLNQKLQGVPFRVECMNFGIGGFETQQDLLCYEHYVRRYHPDLVVMAMFVHNDLSGNAFYLDNSVFGRPYYRPEGDRLVFVPADMGKLGSNYARTAHRLRHKWYHHLQVYNAQKQIFWAIRQWWRWKERTNLAPRGENIWKQAGNSLFRYYAGDDSDPYVQEVDHVSELLLHRMKTELIEDGVAFRIVLLPAKENLYPEKWPEALKDLPGLEKFPMDFERPYKRVASFLPEMTVQNDILDLRPMLRTASTNEPVFYPRDSHFNPKGHEVTAESLSAWLEPQIIHTQDHLPHP